MPYNNYRKGRAAQFNASFVTGVKTAGTGSYVEDEVIMPKTEIPSLVPALIGIEIEHPKTLNASLANDTYSGWHLSTKSQDALIDLADMDCIAAGKLSHLVATEVGFSLVNLIERITFPAPIPITSSKLYMGFTQDMIASHDFKYRLILAPRSIPGVVQQNNLTQSVQF